MMFSKRQAALLVVDDYAAYRAMSETLRRLGLRPRWAKTWEGAKEQLEQENFNIIMLDEGVLNGGMRKVVQWLRQSNNAGQVIVMSDMPDMRSWVDYLNQGVVDLISKTAAPTELKRSIDLALNVGAPVVPTMVDAH